MIHLVQISNGSSRRVAVVEEPHLKCLSGVDSVYALVKESMAKGVPLSQYAASLATGEKLEYDPIYKGEAEWHLLAPIDVPGEPARLLVAGTGLTHLGSAKDRQAMHAKDAAAKQAEVTMTDSMKMFQWGIEGGRPAEGGIGIAPEWFYKGDSSVLQAPLEPLVVPAHGEDGGEEAEVAGVYYVGEDGTPYRIGMATGNEFSDHKFEKRNYLNLAGSKLRTCSIGPELVVGAPFGNVTGHVRIVRDGKTIWEKAVETGEENMAHSLGNLEHHHFKFAGHQQPGNLHVHFFGAQSLSFGEGLELQEGDWMEIRYEGYGRALRNPVRIQSKDENRLVKVHPLS